ncbi:uncharacterized protein N7477_006788 [Penicillium maclennaniae]|uniref:uncharacterized protein n=1 Tax=Penicillium maclennaniae TaxID=1343394 RepID=UPI00253FB13E|nr:uncharacterized protein N7477_006788 [Penicillium maclennaniae]KAJ5668218.1 hypothetical protein N7477_006788 [Penicillium maclennaniae]
MPRQRLFTSLPGLSYQFRQVPRRPISITQWTPSRHFPWRSATERTVATAPLRLEKVHGLTVFLKCGNVVHAILKNSQCWCVDGVSKFVLRIRPLTYYRIELPYDSKEEKESVEELKILLPTVLRYEVTPCPFKRAFTVEIPEDAMAPRRKKAWRPKDRKDCLLSVPGGNQSSPSEGRSECLDSASTGDDTDGCVTDDSMGPQAAKSTTPEPSPPGDESPVFTNTFELPIQPKVAGHSVTENPQTFTSLRAKFDSRPVPGDPLPQGETQVPAQIESAEQIPVAELVQASALEASPTVNTAPGLDEVPIEGEILTQEDAPPLTSTRDNTVPPDEPSAQHGIPSVHKEKEMVPPCLVSDPGKDIEALTDAQAGDHLVLEDSIPTEPASQGESLTTESIFPEASPVSSSSVAPKDLRVLQEISSNQSAVTNAHTAEEALVAAKATIPGMKCALDVPNLKLPTLKPRSIFDRELDTEHDDSFSSTTDSFHSADPTSPSDSISTHSTPEKQRDLSEAGSYLSGSTENSLLYKLDDFPALDTLASNGSPIASTNFVYYEAREIPRKPSWSTYSGIKTDSPPVAKEASPPMDLSHMSTEFRRRAQTTRQRDVSPMPPSSAIYQPNRGLEAKSIFSKTLALVLVPPISLFIILLHITARIVINPAASSFSGEPTSGSRPAINEPTTKDDDFDFPLERETSSEYEDAEITRKLDPWELD